MKVAYVTIEGLKRYKEKSGSFIGYSNQFYSAKNIIITSGYKERTLNEFQDGTKELLFTKV